MVIGRQIGHSAWFSFDALESHVAAVTDRCYYWYTVYSDYWNCSSCHRYVCDAFACQYLDLFQYRTNKSTPVGRANEVYFVTLMFCYLPFDHSTRICCSVDLPRPSCCNEGSSLRPYDGVVTDVVHVFDGIVAIVRNVGNSALVFVNRIGASSVYQYCRSNA